MCRKWFALPSNFVIFRRKSGGWNKWRYATSEVCKKVRYHCILQWLFNFLCGHVFEFLATTTAISRFCETRNFPSAHSSSPITATENMKIWRYGKLSILNLAPHIQFAKTPLQHLLTTQNSYLECKRSFLRVCEVLVPEILAGAAQCTSELNFSTVEEESASAVEPAHPVNLKFCVYADFSTTVDDLDFTERVQSYKELFKDILSGYTKSKAEESKILLHWTHSSWKWYSPESSQIKNEYPLVRLQHHPSETRPHVETL